MITSTAAQIREIVADDVEFVRAMLATLLDGETDEALLRRSAAIMLSVELMPERVAAQSPFVDKNDVRMYVEAELRTALTLIEQVMATYGTVGTA